MNLKGKRGYKILVHKQFAGISSYFIIIRKEFFVDEHSKHSTSHLLHLLFSAFGHTDGASDQMGAAFRVVAPSPFQGEVASPWAGLPYPWVAVPWLHREAFQL